MTFSLWTRCLLFAVAGATTGMGSAPVLAAAAAPDNPCLDVMPALGNIQGADERQRVASSLLRMVLDCRGDDPRCHVLVVRTLMLAVQASNVACVGWWLDRHPGLISEGEDLTMALHVAAADASVEMVRVLIERGARVDARDSSGRTAVAIATQRRRPDVVSALLAAGADPGQAGLPATPPTRRTQTERPPANELDSACVHDNLDEARRALDRGASLEPDVGRPAPLCVAVLSNALHVATLLLERGASVQGPCTVDWDRPTMPLQAAADWAGAAMVSLLLDHGARPARDAYGHTPMDKADRETTRLLRRRGAALGDRWLLYLAPNLLIGADIGLDKQTGNHGVIGLRPELVLKRPYSSLGAGAYLEASTRWWHDGMFGGGLVLVPSTWIVPSVGAYARHASGQGWDWGVAAGVFLGSHESDEAEPPDRRGDPRPPASLAPMTAENFGVRLELRWGMTPADRSIGIMFQLDLDLLYLGPARVLGAMACCR